MIHPSPLSERARRPAPSSSARPSLPLWRSVSMSAPPRAVLSRRALSEVGGGTRRGLPLAPGGFFEVR